MKKLSIIFALASAALYAQTAINDTLYLQGATPWTGQITVSWPAFTSCAGVPIARGSRTVSVNAGVVAISLWPSDCAAPSFAYTALHKTMGGPNHALTWTEEWVVPSSPSIVTLHDVRKKSTLTAQPLAHASTHASGGSDPVTKAQIGLANVDNTSDASKPVSAAQQAALDAKAPLANPTFTGNVSMGSTFLGAAKGDGVQDATADIQAAVNATGKVFIPAGNFRFSGLALPDGAEIECAGVAQTTLTYTGSTVAIQRANYPPKPMNWAQDWSALFSRFNVRNCKIVKDGALGATGFDTGATSHSVIENNHIENFAKAVLLNGVDYGTYFDIVRNNFFHNDTVGVEATAGGGAGANHNTISDNRAFGVNVAFAILGGTANLLLRNDVEFITGASPIGIRVSASGTNVIANWLEASSQTGWTGTATGIKVEYGGNKFFGNHFSIADTATWKNWTWQNTGPTENVVFEANIAGADPIMAIYGAAPLKSRSASATADFTLLAAYDFADSDKLRDLSYPGGNDGTFSTPAPTSGATGLTFDGTATCIAGPNSDLFDGTGPFSIAIVLDRQAGTWQTLADRSFNSAAEGWRLQIDGATKLSYAAPSHGTVTGASNVTTGAWHSAVFVSDGSNGQWYLDGVADGSPAAITPLASGLTPLRIGCRTNNTNDGITDFYKGTIRYARFHRKAFTAAEVAALHKHLKRTLGVALP